MIGLEALNVMLLVTSRVCSKYSFYIKLLTCFIPSKRSCLIHQTPRCNNNILPNQTALAVQPFTLY